MRIIVLLLLCSTSVFAQSSSFSTGTSHVIAPSVTCTETFADLPRIAERLDVKPITEFRNRSMVLALCDGRQYDFVELLNALLDRMDKAHP